MYSKGKKAQAQKERVAASTTEELPVRYRTIRSRLSFSPIPRRVSTAWLHTIEPRFYQQSIIQAPWLKEPALQEVQLEGDTSVRNSPTAGVPGGEPWSRLWVEKGSCPLPSAFSETELSHSSPIPVLLNPSPRKSLLVTVS